MFFLTPKYCCETKFLMPWKYVNCWKSMGTCRFIHTVPQQHHNSTVSHFPPECRCGISEILNILEFGRGGGRSNNPRNRTGNILPVFQNLKSNVNIATGERSWAIALSHFFNYFDCFHFFDYFHFLTIFTYLTVFNFLTIFTSVTSTTSLIIIISLTFITSFTILALVGNLITRWHHSL